MGELGQFGTYASYYDLCNKGKDYAGEVEYILQLLSAHSSKILTILNLGCGTGRHDHLLATMGYKVTGVDLSPNMLEEARRNYSVKGLSFVEGDVREVRLSETFDAVISLFHVMSYQTTNQDLLRAMRTAIEHLNPGGVFVFDCWYGPGVLTDPPVTRVKRILHDEFEVRRLAEPTHDPNSNIVKVDYEVLINKVGESAFERIVESHHMRYLFVPEVMMLAEQAGFSVVHFETWLEGGLPRLDTWNVVFVLKKAS